MAGVRSGLVLALAALALALGVAGCGDEESNSTSTQSTAPGVATIRDTPTSPPEGGEARGAAEVDQEHKGGEASIEEFGSEAEDSNREAILAVFTDYLNALAEEDYAAACSHLSASVQSSLAQLTGGTPKSGSCTAILPKLLAPTAPQIAREQANGDVTKVRVEGDRAFVVFEAPGAELYQLTMVEEGGEWKAATVAASVLVPDL